MRMRRLIAAAGLAACGVIAGYAATPALAQDRGATRVDPPVPIEEREFYGATGPGEVTQSDLAALRYYLRSNQDAKYEAEVRRLQRRNPGWEPPSDLLDPSRGPNVQPLWDLFAEGRYTEVSSRIAELKQENPDWEPPADLVETLELAKQRERLINASDSEQWSTVVRIAQDNPALLRCASVDVIWRTAEAHARLDQDTAARNLYAEVLTSCPATDKRVATLAKAHANLPNADVRRLIEIAREGEPSDPVRREIARIQEDMQQSRLAAAAAGRFDLSQGELERLGARARDARSASLATTLGWYAQNRDDHTTAETWFERGLAWGGGASPALGLALAHQGQDDLDAAESVAEEWEGRSRRIRELYAGLAVDRLGRDDRVADPRLEAYASFADEREHAGVATSLGWEHYDHGRYDAAAGWFDKALDWEPSAAAAEGLALAHKDAGRPAEARATVEEYRGDYPDLADLLDTSGASGPVAQAAAAENYAACVREAAAVAGTESYDAPTAVQYGWCLLALERPAEADMRFREALEMARGGGARDAGQLRTDAYAGRANALLSMGQPQRARDVIRGADLDPAQRQNLNARVLEEYAYAAMEQERYREVLRIVDRRRRYAEPTRGLRVIEAWSHYNIGNNATAARIFRDLDVQFSTDDLREALSVVRKYTP